MKELKEFFYYLIEVLSKHPQTPLEWGIVGLAAVLGLGIIVLIVIWMDNFFMSDSYEYSDDVEYVRHPSANSSQKVATDYFFTIGEGQQFYMVVMPSGIVQSLQVNGLAVNSAGLQFSQQGETTFVIMKGIEIMLAFSAIKLSPGEYQVTAVATNNFSTQHQKTSTE